MNPKTTSKKIDNGRVDELASLTFDWICRYKLDKGKLVWTHEVMIFLKYFEEDAFIRWAATMIAFHALVSLGWVDIKG